MNNIQNETENLILATDSYKLGHWNQYPKDTEAVYSYFEAREGAKFPYTIFFGLQYILKRYMLGQAVNDRDLEQAATLARTHFGGPIFNYRGWSHLITHHAGRLPLKIKAVPEGTPVPNSNVLMTVENTCPECFWLTNAVESMLTHAWYPSTVATLSHHTLGRINSWLKTSADSQEGLPFMLHDFGYRGASSHESAAIGGAAHLIRSRGTDTLPGMLLAEEYYHAALEDLAFSVPATEHSVMTSLGKEGEFEIVDQLLEEYPTGILSVVADSFDIYNFVRTICSPNYVFKIAERDGVFVVRPDSTTEIHKTPEELVTWISNELWYAFGGEKNSKGYRVLDSHVRILWGDGIDPDGIEAILKAAVNAGFSAENYVFGMGGGLLQKVNRDTQRFAFKSSAQKRSGEWHDVHKVTPNKSSKGGRLELVRDHGELTTIQEPKEWMGPVDCGILQTVFENGELVKEYTFDEVRQNAEVREAVTV
jgi:nicotinamide phosphoribosyltransferase